MNSILNSIKKMLGIDSTYTDFDTDIIIAINTAFGILRQLGVGPKEIFLISDAAATWSDFFGKDAPKNLEFVKTWMYMKVKSIFDPASSSTIGDAYDKLMTELEFRMLTEIERPAEEESSDDDDDEWGPVAKIGRH